jgi:hypothetical protein
MLYAEPTNKFSVAGNLNNSGNLIVNQSISNGSTSKNSVRIKINDGYLHPKPTITFTSFSATNRAIVKCNNEELIINPNTSKTIEIKAKAKLYSGYISKTDNKISIDFNKFECKCINCTFMKE